MKSIITEASSIAKAIEQSWKKTGKPQNFSVKVLEEEEKNFLGMTKKPAKIAFFFEETTIQRKKTDQRYQKKQSKHPQRQQVSKPEKKEKKLGKVVPKKQPILRSLDQDPQKKAPERKKRKSPWTEQMITEAKNWTTGMLKEMNMSHITFSVKAKRNNIKYHLNTPLIKQKEKQKALFRNFAFLIMQSIRYKFKKQFRNLKAVFTSD